MNRIAVVGEAPSRWMQERRLLEPLVLAKLELASLAGIGITEWEEKFECFNVLDKWPGRSPYGKGDLFPLAEARIRARELKEALLNRRIILLGRRVASAFDVEAPWFEWRRGTVVVPHPSKVSRWWNDASNRRRAEEFWRSCVRDPSHAA